MREEVEGIIDRLKCMTLMQEMECASEGWMTWQCEMEEMDCGDGVVLDSTGCVGDNNTVEMEVVEHAFLDFLTLELGLDEVTVEYGTTMFVKDEEKTAHNELDKLIGRLQVVDQD
jgi:hypothetical protein